MLDTALTDSGSAVAGTPRRRRSAYLQDMNDRFWRYWRDALRANRGLLDPSRVEGEGAPVFRRSLAHRNLLLPPGGALGAGDAVVAAVPAADRHLWFVSMASSQALAQSVFGSLSALDRLEALEGLEAEDGQLAVFGSAAGFCLSLEHAVSTLGEPRPTSVDALLSGPRRIAVEVKLTEAEFGRCSRPRLKPAHPNYSRDHCDGSFSVQRGRRFRCSLSEIGVRYWNYVPHLFTWSGEEDHGTCPLAGTYQLVRNVLAASVGADGRFDPDQGHALVVYDARNPAFMPGGTADKAWQTAVGALRHPQLLRRVSWQSLSAHLGRAADLDWLVDGLRAKYGFL